MKKAVILLNHNPVKELTDSLKSEGFSVVVPPEEMKQIWGNIPATTNWLELRRWIKPIASYIKENHFQKVIIAGEPTAIYNLILEMEFVDDRFSEKCYAPISERVSIDEPQPDGTVKKVSVFQYKGLRPYYMDLYRD